jgi:DNA-binding MurR/RpiR family transcriptional regulator
MNHAHEMLVRYLQMHPEESFSSVARLLNTSPSTITRIAQRAGLPPRGGNRLTVADVEKLEAK